jgi:hypothetical protein
VHLLINSANRSLNYAEFFGLCAMLFNFCKQLLLKDIPLSLRDNIIPIAQQSASL